MVALGGGAALVVGNSSPDADNASSSSDTNNSTQAEPAPQGPITAITDDTSTLVPVDPSNVDGVVGGVGNVVDSLVGTVTDDGQLASVSVSLTGTGTPGAHLSLQALGQVYATTIVDAAGNYAISASAIPGGLASLDLVQTVDRQYLKGLLGTGLLGNVLGGVDQLVDALIRPLGLASNSGGIAVNLVG